MSRASSGEILILGGGSSIASKTGTSIVFTEDALYNEITYLTSGNLTLSLTGAVKGTYVQVYCDKYSPTISGEEYFVGAGSLDASALNILSFFYDGTKIYLNIGNVQTLDAPSLTLTPSDTEMQVDWDVVTNATNYVIERADDSGFTTNKTEIYNGALLTYTDTGLTNGQTYYYRGKAEATGLNQSGWSATQSAAPSADLYSTMSVAWSLRKFEGWSNAVLKVRRSSDNATSFVFFDGASSQDEISLNSYIDLSSDTTPSTTTLGTWLSTDNLFVETWYGQTPDDIINTSYKATRTVTGEQSQIATSGVLDLTNSKPRLNFDGASQGYFTGSGISALNSGNQFSILSLSTNSSSSTVGTLIGTSLTTADRSAMWNDRRTNDDIWFIRGSSTAYVCDYLSTQNVATQKLLTGIVGSGGAMSSYYNGTAQGTNTASGTYTNDDFKIGSDISAGNKLTGTIQEIIIFASDKTSDIGAIHTDINTHYSIY